MHSNWRLGVTALVAYHSWNSVLSKGTGVGALRRRSDGSQSTCAEPGRFSVGMQGVFYPTIAAHICSGQPCSLPGDICIEQIGHRGKWEIDLSRLACSNSCL